PKITDDDGSVHTFYKNLDLAILNSFDSMPGFFPGHFLGPTYRTTGGQLVPECAQYASDWGLTQNLGVLTRKTPDGQDCYYTNTTTTPTRAGLLPPQPIALLYEDDRYDPNVQGRCPAQQTCGQDVSFTLTLTVRGQGTVGFGSM